LGQRSRKRGRRQRPSGQPPAAASISPGHPARTAEEQSGGAPTGAGRQSSSPPTGAGQQSRASKRHPGRQSSSPPTGAGQQSRASERHPGRQSRSSEDRNAAVRASLKPIAPGERPWPVKVSVVLAFLLGAVNFGLFIAGAKPTVGGQQPQLPEILVFSGLMLLCAAGLWMMRYWALLGFQTLLAIGLVGFCLALIRVSSAVWALVCVVVIGAGGFLFVKLVRVLSRVQMPAPPRR
jgi:hypothetical protein